MLYPSSKLSVGQFILVSHTILQYGQKRHALLFVESRYKNLTDVGVASVVISTIWQNFFHLGLYLALFLTSLSGNITFKQIHIGVIDTSNESRTNIWSGA